MRYLFIIILLLSAKLSNCQDSDSLKKYSYPLVGIKTDSLSRKIIYHLGTCFFLRNRGLLFMVTAKHSLNGYNTFNLTPTVAQYDTIGFRYFDPTTQKISYSSLDIKGIKKYLSNDYFFNSPDMVVLKMNDTVVSPLINSIESLMSDKFFGKIKFDSVVSFGFPANVGHSFSDTTPSNYYSGFISKKIDPYYPINDSLYYVTEPLSVQGMSGSPVFFKYNDNNKSYFTFGGVMFGGDAPYNSAYIVSPSILRRYIANYIIAH